MTRGLVAGLAALVILAVTPGAFAADHQTTVYRFQDSRITESSDLLDYGSLDVTTNDSGDGPYVYVVDAGTGATVGRTDFGADVQDVEAIAPAGPGEVWVGDIGDNAHQRSTVQVYRVPFAAAELTVHAAAYRLGYPDGPHDAESLIAAPDGRLYVISKGITGGTVYAAPLHLSPSDVNELTRVATVDDFATDAALFPGGHYVIVRGYGAASVYTFPAFHDVGSFGLPRQRQGEGISIGPADRIRLSSEGAAAPVLQIRVPEGLAYTVGVPGATAPVTPSSRPTAAPDEPEPGTAQRSSGDDRGWLWWAVPGVLVVGAAGLVLRRRSR